MFLISKMIHDPGWRTVAGNRAGRTLGLVFHSPKYWDCQTYDFDTSQFDEMNGGPLTEKQMARRYEQKVAHRGCKKKHLSYPGYMYWIGPKRRFDFRYMGPTHPREVWWKPFTVGVHSYYTRLLDNGTQPRQLTDEDRALMNSPAIQRHRQKFADTMAQSKAQMKEYTARRDAEAEAWIETEKMA